MMHFQLQLIKSHEIPVESQHHTLYEQKESARRAGFDYRLGWMICFYMHVKEQKMDGLAV